MSESGESDKANLTDQEVGEKLCQDYCATDAPGAKEFRKLAKLGNLLASGALQREDEAKANKKVLSLRCSLFTIVEECADGAGDAAQALQLLHILRLGEICDTQWHDEQYEKLATCLENQMASSDGSDVGDAAEKGNTSSVRGVGAGSSSQVQGTFAAFAGYRVFNRTFWAGEHGERVEKLQSRTEKNVPSKLLQPESAKRFACEKAGCKRIFENPGARAMHVRFCMVHHSLTLTPARLPARQALQPSHLVDRRSPHLRKLQRQTSWRVAWASCPRATPLRPALPTRAAQASPRTPTRCSSSRKRTPLALTTTLDPT